jgi:hypothetical protein
MLNRKWLGLGVLVAAFALTGCTGQKPAAPVAKGPEKQDDDDHEHGPGPHGGVIIELDNYHGEFTVDHGKKEATVYILDGSAKKAKPVAATRLQLTIKSPWLQVDMKPSPQEGDPKGKSSRFVATHDNFGKEQEFEGSVGIEIEGKPYSGDFKEKPHKDEKK